MKKTNLIEIKNVSFKYENNLVLDDITLEVDKGDFLGIIGPNGSGKTTLLRLILGLLTPTTGTITIFGKPRNKFRDFSKIGYVPQKVTQFDSRFPITVNEIVSQGRISRIGLFRSFGKQDKLAVENSLKDVGMFDLRNRLITELSGGQQQRVFIARALSSDPELLVLDEPTVGVDSESQDEFYELLSVLNKSKHLTLLLVSHDIDVVVNEVTKLVCINKKLVYHGKPQKFIKEDYLEKLYGHGRKFILHGH